jgi:tRNA(Ile)-lysidine synthase TilS/MesJ
LKDIERIAIERQIDISSACSPSNREIRRERIASLVEIWEADQAAAGQDIPPLSEAVRKDLESEAKRKGSDERPNRHARPALIAESSASIF